jgi:hypothetical protein
MSEIRSKLAAANRLSWEAKKQAAQDRSILKECNAQRILNEEETQELMKAISQLDEEAKFDCINGFDSWEFDSSLRQYASRWFNIDSCIIIQACYLALMRQAPSPKVEFAIEFFKAEYNFAE